MMEYFYAIRNIIIVLRYLTSRSTTAIKNAESGLIDADYGGEVIKQRIAQHNKGKSGGFRSMGRIS